MNNYDKCETCGKYDLMDSHKCYPKWEVKEVQYDDDDWRIVYAYDAEDAASDYAELIDNGDYDLLQGGDPLRVEVRSFGSEDVKTFEVTGEAVPTYSASEVTL